MKGIAAAALSFCVLFAAPGHALGAAITPNTTADDFDAAPDANCSLREAVESAVTNAATGGCPAGDAGTDTITLTSPVATPYQLTLGADEEEVNAEGDLDVRAGGPIVIRSPTLAGITTTVTDRVIDVRSNANLTLENLRIRDGDVSGVADDTNARGGNIRASGTNTLVLDDVDVRDGTALGGGGGLHTSTGTTLTVNDSEFFGNRDESSGGGIFVLGSPRAVFNRIEVQGNGIDTNILGNIKGGGIRASVSDTGVLEISDSLIVDNFVTHTGAAGADQSFGGGISIASQGTIRRSYIALNEGSAAGGTGVERGGGLQVDGGAVGETLNVVNTTFYDNSIGDAGNSGEGGAAALAGNVGVVFSHVTLSANSATGTGTADHIQRVTGAVGPTTLRGSLITNSFLTNACEGAGLASGGYNALSFTDADCGLGGTDVIGSTAVVSGGGAANGGAVPTIAIGTGSIARDLEPAGLCAAEGTDARGYPRPLPIGGACDAGAYELHSCDGGATVLDGPYSPCFSAIPVGPSSPPPSTKAAKKCKKPKKKKKGKSAGAAAKKPKKGCKKKKKRKKG